jgi:hypothetical protein
MKTRFFVIATISFWVCVQAGFYSQSLERPIPSGVVKSTTRMGKSVSEKSREG